MRLIICLTVALSMLATSISYGHGPQIQTTNDSGKIVTREILDDPYGDSLTSPKSVYAMPLAEYLGVWRAQPDGSLNPDLTPAFAGWPGFAYGYGYDATTNPAPFPLGSKFTLGFTGGLKSWDGVVFVDAGVTEAEIYRGSSAAPSALARTTDSGPFASVQFPGGAGIAFATEQGDTHNTVNYRMVGDGSSIMSPLTNGIYLLSLQLSSTSALVQASDPFYFVLSKNGSTAEVQAAVDSLGFDASRVQNLIPEPITASLATCAAMGLIVTTRRRRKALRS